MKGESMLESDLLGSDARPDSGSSVSNLGELRRRMEEVPVDDVGLEWMREVVVDYLSSGAVLAGNIGRQYSISDPGQRLDFAEWFVGFLGEVHRFRAATMDGGPDGE